MLFLVFIISFRKKYFLKLLDSLPPQIHCYDNENIFQHKLQGYTAKIVQRKVIGFSSHLPVVVSHQKTSLASHRTHYSQLLIQQVVEKVIFLRLFKNIQMQGPRNLEEWGVHASTMQ
jgi:hypothetical protein